MAWEVDIEQLDIKFRALQKALHPDRYANKNDFEKRLAVQTAATINQAYETIKNPLSRAQYLLELVDLDASQETHQTMGAKQTRARLLVQKEPGTIWRPRQGWQLHWPVVGQVGATRQQLYR